MLSRTNSNVFRRLAWALLAAGVTLLPVVLRGADDDPASTEWPSFRGYRARGVSAGPPPPARWNVPENENVVWKVAIPGLGLSSPIVWGERLFVTTAVPEKGEAELKAGLYGDIGSVEDEGPQTWKLFCLDTATGKVLWERTATEGVPRTRRHPKSSHASSTPATDGKHVVSFFGSEGLWCYTVTGELVWKKDLGKLDAGFFRVPDAQWGFGSSPIIHDRKVIVQCDVQGGGFVAAYEVESGKEIWRTPREDVPTWSTPAIYTGGDRTCIALNGWKHIGGYDLQNGKEVWRLTGGGDIPVPTPIVGDGLIYITNAHGSLRPIYAVRVSARGDVSLEGDATSNEHVAWSWPRRGVYMPTPILLDGLLFCAGDNGVIGCYDAKTGEEKYRERLGDGTAGFTASPVAAGGKLFITSEAGDVHVVRAGAAFEPLGVNPLGETCLTTPAIAGGRLFLRGREHVIAIGAGTE